MKKKVMRKKAKLLEEQSEWGNVSQLGNRLRPSFNHVTRRDAYVCTIKRLTQLLSSKG